MLHSLITASSVAPHGLSLSIHHDFNNKPFLTYIYITYIILTESLVLLWSDDDTTYHTVPLYSCNNITLKTAAITFEIYW